MKKSRYGEDHIAFGVMTRRTRHAQESPRITRVLRSMQEVVSAGPGRDDPQRIRLETVADCSAMPRMQSARELQVRSPMPRRESAGWVAPGTDRISS